MRGTTATIPVGDTVSKIDNELAVGEDLQFQRKWWRFERFIWILFAGVIVLDLLGAFGRGWLAKDHLHAADGSLDVQYERIERTGTPSIMTIRFGPSAIQNGKAVLYVSESVVRELGAQRVIPEPSSSMVGNKGVTYTFAASRQPASAEFALQPASPGVFHFTVQSPGSQPLTARVIVAP
jgi:hypothetical protein